MAKTKTIEEAFEEAKVEVGEAEEAAAETEVETPTPAVEEKTPTVESDDDDKQISAQPTEQPENQEKTPAQAIAEQLIDPPVSWKSEYKKWFMDIQSTNKDLAKYLVEREKGFQSDYTQKTQRLAVERQRYAGIESAIQPYQEQLRLLGADPGLAIGRLLAWNDRLAKEPEAALLDLAQTMGVDFNTLLSQQQQQPIDPYVAQMQRELAELKSHVSGVSQERQMQMQQSIGRDVENFLTAKDAAGNPKYPYAEAVTDEMVMLAAQLRQAHPDQTNLQILEQAYSKATRLNDSVWENVQLAEERRKEAERLKKESEKATAAKKAVQASPRSGSSNGHVQSKTKTIDEVLGETFANYK